MKISFPHRKMNGILRYFYKKDKLYFNNTNIFTYNSSGTSLSLYDFNAFNFGSSSYWVSINNDVFLSFCFESGFADLIGYEIYTSTGSLRPHKWSFSASNDNKEWIGKKNETHWMKSDETYYVPWRNGPARCYRFDFTLNAVNTTGQTDIKQIELFGRYFDNNTRQITCRGRNVHNFSYAVMLFYR